MNSISAQIDITKELINQSVTLETSVLLIYLLIALLIGYFIHYIFSHRRDYFRTPKKNPGFYYNESLNNYYYPHTEPIILSEEYIAEEKKELLLNKSSRDDLKIIEGIGPKIENLLNKAKINTWYRLSKTSINKLRSILESASYQMHDPSTWPEQAYLAETRQWEELKRLQNNLNGGKHI